MEKLQQVTSTLFTLHTQIMLTVTTLERVYENKDLINSIKFNNDFFDNQALFQTAVNAIISNNCIIMFCSFLDAYEKRFRSRYLGKELEERVKNVRLKNSFGMSRIAKWKDLKDFRNNLAAHHFEIKGISFFSDEVQNLEYKIPNTISEKKIFLLIIELICRNISSEFPEVLLYMNPRSRMVDKLKIIGEEINLEEEAKIIISQMR